MNRHSVLNPALFLAAAHGLAGSGALYAVPLANQGPKTEPVPRRVGPLVGRNDPCPCGCGQKFKKCPNRR